MHSLIYSAVSVPTLQAVIKVRMLVSKRDSFMSVPALPSCCCWLLFCCPAKKGKTVPGSDSGGRNKHAFLMIDWIPSIVVSLFMI